MRITVVYDIDDAACEATLTWADEEYTLYHPTVAGLLSKVEKQLDAILAEDENPEPLHCTHPDYGMGDIYHCDKLDCPVHGQRNTEMMQ